MPDCACGMVVLNNAPWGSFYYGVCVCKWRFLDGPSSIPCLWNEYKRKPKVVCVCKWRFLDEPSSIPCLWTEYKRKPKVARVCVCVCVCVCKWRFLDGPSSIPCLWNEYKRKSKVSRARARACVCVCVCVAKGVANFSTIIKCKFTYIPYCELQGGTEMLCTGSFQLNSFNPYFVRFPEEFIPHILGNFNILRRNLWV